MIGDVLYTILSTAPEITAILETRVYPIVGPEYKIIVGELTDQAGEPLTDENGSILTDTAGDKRPFIAYRVYFETAEYTKQSLSVFDTWTAELSIFGRTYAEVNKVSKAARAALDRYKGTVNGVAVADIRFTDFDDEDFNNEMKTYLQTLEFSIKITT